MSKSQAEYYQQHKDDDVEWGDPVPTPGIKRRRLASMISVRFSPDEARLVRAAAVGADESVSTFIRTATMRRLLRVVPTQTMSGPPSLTWNDLPVTRGGPTPADHADWKPGESLLERSSTA